MDDLAVACHDREGLGAVRGHGIGRGDVLVQTHQRCAQCVAHQSQAAFRADNAVCIARARTANC